MSQLSHFDEGGRARMVEVGEKPITMRLAKAAGCVLMRPETLRLITDRAIAKGDVFEVARIAGITGAKRTADLIPLCHPIGLDNVEVHFDAQPEGRVRVEAIARCHGRTGVEMEALTAVATACLTIYDMCKSVDRQMCITDVRLLEKAGGRSGHFVASGT
ncbi:MAG: cyclic pyranopterin monophosphate synthase MoaC [Planctomycetaceae bacterium]|nr:cyclic pyranopterin monophosphate synthase MoaC [Planctomycetaceae bacterium]